MNTNFGVTKNGVGASSDATPVRATQTDRPEPEPTTGRRKKGHALISRYLHLRDSETNQKQRNLFYQPPLAKPSSAEEGFAARIVTALEELKHPLTAAVFGLNHEALSNAIEKAQEILEERFQALKEFNEKATRTNKAIGKALRLLDKEEEETLEPLLQKEERSQRRLSRCQRDAASRLGKAGVAYNPASPQDSLKLCDESLRLQQEAAAERILAAGEKACSDISQPDLPSTDAPVVPVASPPLWVGYAIIAILGVFFGLFTGAAAGAFKLSEVYKLANLQNYWFGLCLFGLAGPTILFGAKQGINFLTGYAARLHHAGKKFWGLLVLAFGCIAIFASIDMANMSLGILSAMTQKLGPKAVEGMRFQILLTSLSFAFPYLVWCATSGWNSACEKMAEPGIRREKEADSLYQLRHSAVGRAAAAQAKQAQSDVLASVLTNPLCAKGTVAVNLVLVCQHQLDEVRDRIAAERERFDERRRQLEGQRIELRDDLTAYDMQLIEEAFSTAWGATYDQKEECDELIARYEEPDGAWSKFWWNLGFRWFFRLPFLYRRHRL